MKRKVSILFIIMLLFQSISGGLVGIVDAANAEGLTADGNVLTIQSITEEDGTVIDLEEDFREDTEVELIIAWEIAEGNNELSSQIPANILEHLTLEKQEGQLLSSEEQVGTFLIDADGNLALTLDGELGASGTLKVSALIKADIDFKEETKEPEGETIKENLGNESAENAVSVKDIEDAKEEQDNNPVEETVKGADINTLASRAPQLITEDIIDEIRLKYKDGSEFQEGDLISVDDELRFELDWSLLNDNDYIDGDYFEFQLPEQLTIINKIENGDLGGYGTFDLGLDGKVRFTFDDEVERESDIKGTFWFETQLEKRKITTTEETVEIVFDGKVVQTIIVNVKPTGGQAITKEGQPVNGNFNAEEVQWNVVVNTTRESLKNGIINDPILAGQALILDSVVLKEVEVDLAGEVTKELDEVVGFANNSTVEKLNIELGDTNKAYKLTFKTKLLEDQFKEGTTKYENTAYLTSDGIEDTQAGGSVSVSRPKSMEKTSSTKDQGRTVEWEVKANFTEQNLKKGNEITDEFTFKVGNDEVDAFEIKPENIEVVQVDEFNNKGEATKTSNAKNLFEITIDGNKVTYKLKDATNKAFILKYKTTLKDGAYIHKDGKINNTVNLNGKTDTDSERVYQQVGKKTTPKINYEDKTIDWTIVVNADKQDLRNVILTDSFAGAGQKLVENSITITPENGVATITPNPDKEGFKIEFGNITKTYTIKYQTKFTYDFGNTPTKPKFKNGVNINYKTSDGFDYALEFKKEVTPNSATRNNGAKNGKANIETKEITWTVDINYNQLDLQDAKVKDLIPDNELLIDNSVKVYKTSIEGNGVITVGDDVTDSFTLETTENKEVNINFGEIDKSYRIEFKTKDKDDLYNSDEVYTNTAQFIPREGEVHNLTANVTLPNQGEYIGKTGTHNKEDWTIDWRIDVNKSLSTIDNVTVTDDLGDKAAQILLKDTIKVTEAGSTEPLIEGEDYNLTITDNQFKLLFLNEITKAYEVTYSSYIVAEETVGVTNEAEVTSGKKIVGTTEKVETVNVKISAAGGTGEGATGNLVLLKTQAGTDRVLENVEFNLVKTIGGEEVVVRQGKTDAEGKLKWKGLKYGTYTLNEVIPEGYTGVESRSVTVSADTAEGGVKTIPIENERKTGEIKIIKVDSVTGETLEGAEFTIKNQTTKQEYTFSTDQDGVILEEVPFGEYTVKEIKAANGYRITKNIPNITVEIDKTATIEVEDVAFIDVAGQKSWIVDEGKILPENITVELLANGQKIDEQTVTKANNWKYSFKNLDKYNKANREIKYEINEIEVDGYTTEKDGFDLTNIQTTNITGTKTWIDDEDATENRSESIVVQVLNGDEVVQEKEVTAEENWTYTFTDLLKYDTEGNKIAYTINEVSVDGYKTVVNDFNITNLRANKTSVTGEKTWKDEDPTDRPDEINVELTREIKGEIDDDFSETQIVKPDAKGNWVYEFKDLDEFDTNGVAYTYLIKENNVPVNYEATIEGYDITNLRVGETEVSGTKRWKDDKVADRPEFITVNLLRNNVVVDTVKVTAQDNWEYTFTKLDKYDEDGKYYNYTVTEEQVLGYAPEVTGQDITNTRSEKTNFEITKGWLDDNSADRPDSVIVYVYQNEKLFDTVNVKATNDWVYELNNLEAYDQEGQPYTYTIKEKPLEDYKATINGFNITNLRVGKTEVSGTKIWQDNGDATGDRPDSITVKLLQNGKEIATQEVTASENWEYSFTGLDKYDEYGTEWGYTVDEVDVDGYESEVNGFDITNVRIGTIDIPVSKHWKDDQVSDRPDSITVDLLQNGEKIDTVKLTAEMDWKVTFKDLQEFDEDGKAFEYTVEEKEVEGYTTSVEGFDIMNTLKPSESLEKPSIEQPSTGPKEPGKPSIEKPDDGQAIPKTATQIYNILLIGFGFLVTGSLVLFIRKRRRA